MGEFVLDPDTNPKEEFCSALKEVEAAGLALLRYRHIEDCASELANLLGELQRFRDLSWERLDEVGLVEDAAYILQELT